MSSSTPPNVGSAVDAVLARILDPTPPALLVGISGIDASGKGYLSSVIADELRCRHRTVAVINADGWLNLPEVRFNDTSPGAHFYEHALRLDEMFRRLILPLKTQGSIRLVADLLDETADRYHTQTYDLEEIEIVLVEGIFIFKEAYRALFDLRIWIDCSFETALKRAIARGQEGLDQSDTVRAYQTTYFPAQRIHAERDLPRSSAHVILNNDQPTKKAPESGA